MGFLPVIHVCLEANKMSRNTVKIHVFVHIWTATRYEEEMFPERLCVSVSRGSGCSHTPSIAVPIKSNAPYILFVYIPQNHFVFIARNREPGNTKSDKRWRSGAMDGSKNTRLPPLCETRSLVA